MPLHPFLKKDTGNTNGQDSVLPPDPCSRAGPPGANFWVTVNGSLAGVCERLMGVLHLQGSK